MKTIEEALNNPAINRGLIMSSTIQIAERSFKSGVDFAQKWITISEEKPKYYDSCLVKFENGEILLVWRAWSESIGSDIYTICGTNIISDSNPIEWKPINIE